MVHALNLSQGAFHRCGYEVIDIGGRPTGKRVQHLRPRDQNLRIFFAWRQRRGEPSDRQAEQHEDRCELGFDEVVGDPAGRVELLLAHALAC